MTCSLKKDEECLKKQIQILASCKQGLLTSLILKPAAQNSSEDRLFWTDSICRILINKGNDSHIRISYIALLKICFEKSSAASSSVLKKLKEQICKDDVSLDLYPVQFISSKYSEYYSNTIFKKILLEFFVLLQYGNRSILDYIIKYPIIDTIMLIFLKTLVWNHKPDELIETQKITIDSLIAYFKEKLQINLTNRNDQIIFQDYEMHIGFQNWYLFLQDNQIKRLARVQQSRVTPFEDSLKQLINNNSLIQNNLDTEHAVPNDSWTIPQQSIYERLDSQDYRFTEKSFSREKKDIPQLVYSNKRTLSMQSQSGNINKNKISSSYTQRAEFKVMNDTDNKSRVNKFFQENPFSHSDVKITKFTDCLEQGAFDHPIRP